MHEDLPVPPPVLANARVLEYAILDQRVKYSGYSDLFVDGKILGPVPYLAIYRHFDRPEFYLFYCNLEWEVLGIDTCASVAKAEAHAERAYPGVSECWIKSDVTEAEARKYCDLKMDGLRCSFCGKAPEEVDRIIEQRAVRICNHCIAEFHKWIHE
jgi:hypothetical protein